MPKRTPHRPLSPAERARTRRVLAVMAVTAALLTTAFVALRWPWRARQAGTHPHRAAAHDGGVLVSVGEGDQHAHAEAVLERRGVLTVYTFGDDATTVREVESQVLTALVRPEGEADDIAVTLLPAPQRGDAAGKTSRFFARLPQGVRGRPVAVTVPDFAIDGQRFRLEFPPATGTHGGGPSEGDEEERAVFLTPGGKYTGADIEANGGVPAAQKFGDLRASHGDKAKAGDRVCPVTRLKAHPACTWAVSGQSYSFCCPPCVEEFVRTAKARPDEVEDAADYVRK